MSSARTVLVLGANGRFGRAAVEGFATAGWQVWAQTRRPLAYAAPPRVQVLQRSVGDAARQLREGSAAAVVVHAANPAYTAWGRELLPLAREAMDAAGLLGARLMLPGNVYNFGSGMPARLREDSPQEPDTRKGRWRRAMEDELRARAADGLHSVVIRAGDFLGCASGSWLDLAIAKQLPRARLVYPGPLQAAHAWAYLPDLARAFVAVAEQRDRLAVADRLHFAGYTLTGEELLAALQTIAEEAGLRPHGSWRRSGMPWTVLRAGAWLVPMWRELAEMAYLWRVPHALDDTRLQALVGPLPATPLLTALRESLLRARLLPDAQGLGATAARA